MGGWLCTAGKGGRDFFFSFSFAPREVAGLRWQGSEGRVESESGGDGRRSGGGGPAWWCGTCWTRAPLGAPGNRARALVVSPCVNRAVVPLAWNARVRETRIMDPSRPITGEPRNHQLGTSVSHCLVRHASAAKPLRRYGRGSSVLIQVSRATVNFLSFLPRDGSL